MGTESKRRAKSHTAELAVDVVGPSSADEHEAPVFASMYTTPTVVI